MSEQDKFAIHISMFCLYTFWFVYLSGNCTGHFKSQKLAIRCLTFSFSAMPPCYDRGVYAVCQVTQLIEDFYDMHQFLLTIHMNAQ